MSLLKPTININPAYTTNNIDSLQAGLYQISPNNSNLVVRVNTTSNIGLSGEIALNTSLTPHIFQGYNGNNWVDLNATQGAQGNPGVGFTNAVNFNNLQLPGDSSIIVPLGSVFATTYANVALNISNVNVRSLQGGNYSINSNLVVNSLSLSQNSNIITLTSQPLPYKWDFTGSNNTISLLKNTPSDTINYSWGDCSKWIVKEGYIVLKGQAVQITNDINNSIPNSNLAIIPITYTSLIGISPFTTPLNMLGISTQNVIGGNSNTCIVCTKGITSVLCTSNITTDFTITSSVSSVGIDGLVGRDGGIFCNLISIPPVDYIKAGYFLETGNVAGNGNYALFYVSPQLQIS
jgi:hypothetical protein